MTGPTPPVSWMDHLKLLAPDMVGTIARVGSAPEATADLGTKLRSFIRIGVDLVITHIYPGTVGNHMRSALAAGASIAELIEVFQIACAVSTRGYPQALTAVLEEAGLTAADLPGAPASDRAAAFRASVIDKTGFWDPRWDAALAATPEYSEAMLGVCHTPDLPAALDKATRALIGAALCGCPALADIEGVRLHTRAALAAGATPAQVIQALQFATGIGIHAFATGLPIAAKLIEDAA